MGPLIHGAITGKKREKADKGIIQGLSSLAGVAGLHLAFIPLSKFKSMGKLMEKNPGKFYATLPLGSMLGAYLGNKYFQKAYKETKK